MNSMERILAAVQWQEVDRLPFILNLTHHGAKILHQSIREYYSKAENMVKGQIQLQNKYQDDAVVGISYFALEFKAWGGEVKFFEDGPPNSMKPIFSSGEDIYKAEIPRIEDVPEFLETIKTMNKLKDHFGDKVPIVGGILSPFSFPIMQMGFNKYIELIYQDLDTFRELMRKNSEFAVNWANTQLDAGATFIVYFDPMASPEIIPLNIYKDTGLQIAREIIPRIKGPVVYHFASSSCQKIINKVTSLPVAAVGISNKDNISECFAKSSKKKALMGNLSGIQLAHSTPNQVIDQLKQLVAKIPTKTGFIVSDHHGEIPYYVSDEILTTISQFFNKKKYKEN